METSVDELVTPLAGADWWVTPASAGVPSLKVTDGPSGARGEQFVGGPPSVWFPCGAALGATWDVELLERVGGALAEEALAKGAHVLLAPTVNIQRDPLGGRHFECMAEDPVLTAHLASAYVRGLQERGVAACVKHLVANDAEDDRFEVSSDVDERTLREVSLLPFEHALRGAGAWSVMAAYNRLNGTHCSQHHWLLTEVLRDEWGWDGAVISDWFGTRDTIGAALGGLDLEMPGPPLHYGPRLVAAVHDGAVPRSAVVAKRDHLRVLAERTGATERPPAPDRAGGEGDTREVARDAAAAAIVLLRNEPVGDLPLLPLDAATMSRVAVIGPNAGREVVGGGGSARLTPTEVTTVLDGLRAALGDDRVAYEAGCRADRGTPAIDGRTARRSDGSPGIDVAVLDDDGEVRTALAPRDFRVMLASDPWPGAGDASWTLKASCTYTPVATGVHRFKLRTNTAATLRVGGVTVIDSATGSSEGEAELVEGEPVEITATGSSPDTDAGVFRAGLELRCAPPLVDEALHHAVEVAHEADAAVVVIGLDGEWETEGRDREDLSLPGDQAELVRRVAAAQPNTVVVVLAGSPVDLSWRDEVPALVWGWYPGQEGGTAIADVLLGAREPGGRLPCTMPERLEDTLAAVATRGNGHVGYDEGVFNGHRRYDRDEITPAYPFGFGLSYARIEVGTPTVSAAEVAPGDAIAVTVEAANVGDRAGSEVVQLYVRDVEASVSRPDRELRAFAKVHLEPGERRELALQLGPRDLAFWDDGAHGWRAEAGRFELLVGRSSRDIVGAVDVALTADWTAPASWWPATEAAQ